MNLYDIVAPMTMAEAKTDYQKRREHEKRVELGNPTGKPRVTKQTDYAKKRAQDKKEMELGEQDPCWKDYKQVGMKKKGSKQVPNCVPKESSNDFMANDSTSPIGGNSQFEDAWHDGDNSWSSDNHEMVESDVEEGSQDFNRVEPYAVCLSGKPIKKFDYYADARRFHDNWKKKLYNAGEQDKADKITLMPLNLDEATPRHFGPKGAGTELARQTRQAEIDRKFNTPELLKKDADYRDYRAGIKKAKVQVKKSQVKEFAPGPGRDDDFDPETANMAHQEGVVKGYSLVDHATLEQALQIPSSQWGKLYNGQYKQYFVKGFMDGRKAKLERARKDGVELSLQKDGSLSRVQQGVAEMDKSQKGPAGWNLDDYDYGKGKWTQGKIVKAKDAVKDMSKELNRAFSTEPKGKKSVKESYWTKLQNERSTKLNSLVNELAESIKK